MIAYREPMARKLSTLLRAIRRCAECEDLPLGPRPVVQVGAEAGVVIIGQAPGTKVHETGVPWQDASGDHLREWLGIEDDVFYDPDAIALIPMGFCYPGKKGSGDAPPRPECAPLWHEELLSHLRDDALILLVGQYAQKHYLQKRRKKSLTETVRAFESYLPEKLPLPHPSWRSKIWMKNNPWFANDVLPRLRREVATRIG